MNYVAVVNQQEWRVQQRRMRQELAVHGFAIDEEGMEHLRKAIGSACKQYELIETDGRKLFQIIERFQTFPYMTPDRFVQKLEYTIYLFYGLRSIYPYSISDEALLQYVYDGLLFHHGEYTKQTRIEIMKMIQREEASCAK